MKEKNFGGEEDCYTFEIRYLQSKAQAKLISCGGRIFRTLARCSVLGEFQCGLQEAGQADAGLFERPANQRGAEGHADERSDRSATAADHESAR